MRVVRVMACETAYLTHSPYLAVCLMMKAVRFVNSSRTGYTLKFEVQYTLCCDVLSNVSRSCLS